MDEIVNGLKNKDPELTDRVIKALQEDSSTGERHSEALLAINAAFRGEIRGWIRGKWFPLDDSLVDETWNETLFRVYSRISAYEKDSRPFVAWVYNQARYAALDILRREVRQLRHRSYPAGRDEAVESPEELLGDLMTAREKNALKKAMRALSAQEQHLLTEHFIKARTYKSISDELNGALPPNHVRVYVHRAVKKLRKLYSDELGENDADV